MGPPLFSDGNLGVARLVQAAEVASMGPPLFSDGNKRIDGEPKPNNSSFNGAAAFQRRKRELRSALGWPQRSCFNGAAAFQRRKPGSISIASWKTWALQWGRRFSATET